MPPPLAIICEICGGKFSKHSLVIHQKACVAKREASTSFCPVCDCLVSNDEYGSHVTECKRVNGQAAADVKKATAAAKAKAAKADKAKAGAAAKPGDLSVVGNDKTAAAEAASASAAAAATAKPQQRSKIPESVLKRLAGAANGEKQLTPEQRLQKCLGVDPCLACGGPKAAVACMGCHAVYCKPCSDMIHECNKALSDHKPYVKEDIVADAPAEVVDHREPCPICERRFDAGKIARHRLVCTKQSQRKPRKVFKSAREQRMKGTDLEKYIKAVEKSGPLRAAPSRWRAQHESIMRMAGVDKAEDEAALHAAIEKAKGSGDPVAKMKAEKELAELRAAAAAAAEAGNAGASVVGAAVGAGGGGPGQESSIAPSPGSVGTAATSSSSVSAGAVTSDMSALAPTGMATPVKSIGGGVAGGEGGGGDSSVSSAAGSGMEPGALDSSMLSAGGSRKPRPLQVGDKVVLVERGVWGVIQYKGPVWGLKPKGNWFGVEFFDAPHGKGDGSYQGTPYFYTKPGFASFLLPEKVRRFVEGEVLKAGQPAHEATLADGSKVAATATTASAAVVAAPQAPAAAAASSRPASQQSAKGGGPASASTAPAPPASRPWMKKPGSESGAASTPAPAAAAASTTTGSSSSSSSAPAAAVASTGVAHTPAGVQDAAKVAAAISKSVIAPGLAATPASSSPGLPRPGSASKGGATGIPSPTKAAPAGATPAAVSPRQPSTLTRVGSRIPAPAAKAEVPAAPAAAVAASAAPTPNADVPVPTADGGVAKLVGSSSAQPWLNKLKAKMEAAGGVTAVAAVVAAQQASKSPTKDVAGPALLRAASSPDVVQHQREAGSSSDVPTTSTSSSSSSSVPPASTAPPAPAARPASASAASSTTPSGTSPPPKFNASLVSKLRAKVEGERAPAGAAQAAASGKQAGRLVAEVKAKQAAAAVAAPSTAKPASPAHRPASAASGSGGVAASSSSGGGAKAPAVSLEEQRRRDIARNVDFLRVLNGEKSTLAADPGDGSGRGSFYAFAGSGHKLGGGGGSENSGPPVFKGPLGTLGADGKRRVVVDGKVQLAKGATDAVSERERRAAAALARVSANVSQPTAAPAGGNGQ